MHNVNIRNWQIPFKLNLQPIYTELFFEELKLTEEEQAIMFDNDVFRLEIPYNGSIAPGIRCNCDV